MSYAELTQAEYLLRQARSLEQALLDGEDLSLGRRQEDAQRHLAQAIAELTATVTALTPRAVAPPWPSAVPPAPLPPLGGSLRWQLPDPPRLPPLPVKPG